MEILKAYRPELIASSDKDRHNITDPYLDTRAKAVVATNGYSMVSVPADVDDDERSRYLAASLLKAARSLGKEGEPARIVDQEIANYGVLWPADQLREFPDWRAVVPRWKRGSKGTASIALDTRLLASLAQAMTSGKVVLTFEIAAGTSAPVLVTPLGEQERAFGVLMPLRAEGDGGVELDDGQVCPVCHKVLASGAWCPKHGEPKAARAKLAERAELERQADGILANAGDGAMNAKTLTGEAAARKPRKGGARA